MKKTVSVLMALAMASALTLPLVACKGGEGDEKIDKTRTQVSVYTYNGGYGADWLRGAKERFEAIHAEDSYEEGKKGVQLMLTPIKEQLDTQTIALGEYDVYFAEKAYYDELLSKSALLDLTDAIANTNSYDNKKIEDKLTDAQKDFYGVAGNDNKTHYYALPHYLGGAGLIYNIDLFDEYGWYFTSNADSYSYERGSNLGYNFLGGLKMTGADVSTLKKSKGPDGVADTDDDGLPATYDEFYLLCEYIVQCQKIPVVWNGYRNYNYTNWLLHALAMQNEGAENAMLNYTFSGTATDLVKANSGAPAGPDGTFTEAQLESYTLTDSAATRKEMQRQAGKYYALTFLKKLIDEADTWTNGNCFNNGYTHTQAQQDFIWGSKAENQKDIAMLVEGAWAMNEGKSNFASMEASFGSDYAMKNRNIGWMPLPRAHKGLVAGENYNVLMDNMRSLCFVSSKVSETVKPIAVDFVKFCNSDSELVKYTQSTNTVKALSYSLTEAELAEVAPFGRSMMKYVQSPYTKVVYPQTHAVTYKTSPASFDEPNLYQAKFGNNTVGYPINGFGELNYTALEYFKNLI